MELFTDNEYYLKLGILVLFITTLYTTGSLNDGKIQEELWRVLVSLYHQWRTSYRR